MTKLGATENADYDPFIVSKRVLGFEKIKKTIKIKKRLSKNKRRNISIGNQSSLINQISIYDKRFASETSMSTKNKDYLPHQIL